jgi:hypothetical protein
MGAIPVPPAIKPIASCLLLALPRSPGGGGTCSLPICIWGWGRGWIAIVPRSGRGDEYSLVRWGISSRATRMFPVISIQYPFTPRHKSQVKGTG